MQDEGIQRDHHSAMAKAFVTRADARDGRAVPRDLRRQRHPARRSVAARCATIPPGYGVARYFADAEAVFTFEGTFDMNSLIVGRAITGIAAFV